MSARLAPLIPGSAPPLLLQRPVLLIGRHPDCDLRIDSPYISERHCCLAQSDQRLIVRDLGSRNGVRVNGRLVEEARLLAGDEVAIAHLIFRTERLPTEDKPVAAAPKPVAAQPRPNPQAAAAAPVVTGSAAPSQGPIWTATSLPDLPLDMGDSGLVPIDDL